MNEKTISEPDYLPLFSWQELVFISKPDPPLVWIQFHFWMPDGGQSCRQLRAVEVRLN